MEVNNVKTMNTGYSSPNTRPTASTYEAVDSVLPTIAPGSMDGTESSKSANDRTVSAQSAYLESRKSLTREDVAEISHELSEFMQLLNADIRFSLHEKSQRLIVQVVDIKQNKVLKEFPPHELLDTMARISEYVGILLDKKA